jgi:hypothetical protein
MEQWLIIVLSIIIFIIVVSIILSIIYYFFGDVLGIYSTVNNISGGLLGTAVTSIVYFAIKN